MKKAPFDSFLPSGGVDSFDPTQAPVSHLNAPTNAGAMPLFEHLGPEATALLLQRREQHMRHLREAWQAERAHLEGIRDQAEAMIEEERAMMDEERLLWAEQKITYQNEITDWKKRSEVAECKVAELVKLLEIMSTTAAKPYEAFDGPSKINRLGSSGSTGDHSPSANLRGSSDGFLSTGLPAGRMSTMPESKPFIPLDPRMQSPPPQSTISHKESERVRQIDITDIIPGLEGIRLKAPAVQKSTFNDGQSWFHGLDSSKQSGDLATSQQANLEPRDDEPVLKETPRLDGPPVAGETSLKSSDNDPNTGNIEPSTDCPELQLEPSESGTVVDLEPSESGTVVRLEPSDSGVVVHLEPSDASPGAHLDPKHDDPQDGIETRDDDPEARLEPRDVDPEAPLEPSNSGSEAHLEPSDGGPYTHLKIGNDCPEIRIEPSNYGPEAELEPSDDDPAAFFEPSDDDPALKGPLSLRNRPMADEAFLKKLWDKLEEVKATEATPSVLGETATVLSSGTNDDDNFEDTKEHIGGDLPLKFKPSSNFGLPFGHIGHTYAF